LFHNAVSFLFLCFYCVPANGKTVLLLQYASSVEKFAGHKMRKTHDRLRLNKKGTRNGDKKGGAKRPLFSFAGSGS
jgi:hypothetical protein